MNRILITALKNNNANYHSSAGIYGFIPKSSAKLNLDELPLKKYGKNVYHLSKAYQEHGFKIADINPFLQKNVKKFPILDPQNYGYEKNEIIQAEDILFTNSNMTVEKFTNSLHKIYCDKIGVELQHLQEIEKEWFSRQFEELQLLSELSAEERKDILSELMKSQVFDNFLATKYPTVKRYGGEGAESMISFFMELLKQSCLSKLEHVVIGIPHRGRLNLLTGLLNFPPIVMFKKMMGSSEFPIEIGKSGDVLSHLTSSSDYNFKDGSVHVTLLPNPSHLEAVSPVVMGYARSCLQTLKVADYGTKSEEDIKYPVLPVQVHGDASFSGQGVVMETLAMSDVPHFTVGGSVHLVVNNQIGFTTPSERGRSSYHCSDLMKMISAPIIHVNGDYPEEALKAAKLALSYRQTFKKDILVNLLCFRRWGHNEMDDPTVTNPLMYKIISSRKSVPDMYAETLIKQKIIKREDVEEMSLKYYKDLNEDLKQIESHETKLYGMQKDWKQDRTLKESISFWDTGVPIEILKFVGAKSAEIPQNFDIHPNLSKNFVQERHKKILKGDKIDWATAEAMAFGSLLYQGHNVRISGQDVGRGTFSQRHVMLVDQSSGEMYVPLNHMYHDQNSFLEVANTILSEEGVLGFEYGFNIENTQNLLIWEAQFGDFFNSAQVVFDTCISSGETKWLLPSNIVILLPHGYDGAGPEHSSCRIERFLQMSDSSENKIDSDDVNWHIVNPTTPAQYFHLLRNQILNTLKKPLIVVAPKILLRHPMAVSRLEEMAPGQHFKPVIEDHFAEATNTKTVVFCSGKHYYMLQKERESRNKTDCAIIRLERLCPFPAEDIHHILKTYKNAKNFIWSQEEHQNMGAWTFINSRFRNILGCELKYAGRPPLGTPAVGIGKLHQSEVQSLMREIF